jgi:copper chaperone CopZ
MFDFLKKKNPNTASIVVKIGGMHCTSCAMNIDGALEDLEGIVSASTNYAKSEVKVEYSAEKVEINEIFEVIKGQGYQVIE